MSSIPGALHLSKRSSLYDISKIKIKQSQLDEAENDLKSRNHTKLHTGGSEKDETAFTMEPIAEEKEFRYIEDDGNSFVDRTFYPGGPNDIYSLDNFCQSNIKMGTLELRGDQKDDEFNQTLQALIEENTRITQINNIQKGQIERLQLENTSVKEVNLSLNSKSNINVQFLSNTINTLQEKITELNTRLETHQVNTIEKEKNIQQLIDILQGIPKQLHSVMNLGRSTVYSSDAMTLDRPVSDFKDSSMDSSFPMQKLNYKLSSKSHSIKVLCRVKPDSDNRLSVPTNDTIYLPPFKNFDRGMGYRLNKVFGSESNQMEIFEEICPILRSCFSGCNVCLMTYGQSGSGKTHTMIGTENEPGIMLLSVKELINIKNESTTTLFRFHLTILEIYNENIYDLMGIKTRVFIQDNGQSVQIKDVSEAEIMKENEFSFYINNSLKRRSNSITSKNVTSSRSHYLVMIRVSGISKDVGTETNRGSLIMCDLAGSENCNGLSDKEQRESKFINKSITMLNRVFDSMYRKLPAIPFRDSKLTHLLKPSLMGNAKCIFIATVSGRSENILDTYRTLNVAKKVEMIHYNHA